MTQPFKIAFIKARWHADIVDQALVGFNQRMQADGFVCEVSAYDVPGAFEAPLLAKRLAATHDAIVVAALVVDGGIYRHDFVAAAVVNGLMQAQLETDTPMLSVSLTPHHFHAHEEHQSYFREHFLKKGSEAAEAVQMVLKTVI
ncbi:MAG: 6,7-dimethyl-8-ribityllumazine synthase [Rhodobacteraceae bacterium]|nr:6,7-dimethyl-8-ribityllumazine synthase [Paracoccaceae bacterium]